MRPSKPYLNSATALVTAENCPLRLFSSEAQLPLLTMCGLFEREPTRSELVPGTVGLVLWPNNRVPPSTAFRRIPSLIERASKVSSGCAP